MTTVPRHIAVIMDGNGRWARERGLPRIKGHMEGSQAAGRCVEACAKAGVEFLTLYAFSTENWKRPPEEVGALMELLERFLKEKRADMVEKKVRLQTIGRTGDLPPACQAELRETIAATAGGTALTLILALSYSGRLEVIDGIRNIVRGIREGTIREEDISPELLSQNLYTKDYPDPDLLIRTSGEMRLSNFLLWQISYTELYVTPKCWPDFDNDDLQAAINDYSARQRRYGGL